MPFLLNACYKLVLHASKVKKIKKKGEKGERKKKKKRCKKILQQTETKQGAKKKRCNTNTAKRRRNRATLVTISRVVKRVSW